MGAMSRSRVGIKFCGGCNSHIDRLGLAKELEEKAGDRFQIDLLGDSPVDVVVVINGCKKGCGFTPDVLEKGRKCVVVEGENVDILQAVEEVLSRGDVRVIRFVDGFKLAE